jgi:excisionase family DNA binding protein
MASTSTLLTLREAARRLGVHESTVRRYADRGLIGAVRLPSGVRRLRGDDVVRLAARLGRANFDDGEPGTDETPETTLEALIAAQRIEPLTDVGALAAHGVWSSDDEVESFIAMTRAERDRDR